MLGIKIYRILTFILLPIEVLMGLMALLGFMIIMASGNIADLLGVLMIFGSVIYIFSSFRFLNSGIEQHKPLKANLKHWIQANAFVTIGFSVYTIIKFSEPLFNPNLIQGMYQQIIEMQGKMQAQKVPMDVFKSIMKGMLIGMITYAVILLVHTFMSFRFVRQYQHLFDEE